MRLPSYLSAVAFFVTAALCPAWGDSGGSAMNAIRQIPRGDIKKIAVVEARDGTPAPERWYILVNDPKDENGLHEYVVAAGEVVASRNLSQFAESLKPADVVGGSSIRVDSDQLANLAQQYALANNVTIAALNYSLKKEGADAAPLWTVTCLDEAGKEVGRIVVSAGKGTIVSHEGFTAEPGAGFEKIDTQSLADGDEDQPRHRSSRKTQGRKVPGMQEKKDVFSRIGNSLSKFFTGH